MKSVQECEDWSLKLDEERARSQNKFEDQAFVEIFPETSIMNWSWEKTKSRNDAYARRNKCFDKKDSKISFSEHFEKLHPSKKQHSYEDIFYQRFD